MKLAAAKLGPDPVCMNDISLTTGMYAQASLRNYATPVDYEFRM